MRVLEGARNGNQCSAFAISDSARSTVRFCVSAYCASVTGAKPASAHRPSHSSEWRRSRIARPARAVSEALRRPMRQWPSPHGAGDGTTSWATFRPRGCGWWADDLSAGNHKSRAMLWTPEGANRRLARWSRTGQPLLSAHQTPVTCSTVSVSPPVAGRRKGAGDGRRNGASRTGGKTRIRTVSRLRFFAVFGNCILRGIWHRFRGAVTVALEDEPVGAVA